MSQVISSIGFANVVQISTCKVGKSLAPNTDHELDFNTLDKPHRHVLEAASWHYEEGKSGTEGVRASTVI